MKLGAGLAGHVGDILGCERRPTGNTTLYKYQLHDYGVAYLSVPWIYMNLSSITHSDHIPHAWVATSLTLD